MILILQISRNWGAYRVYLIKVHILRVACNWTIQQKNIKFGMQKAFTRKRKLKNGHQRTYYGFFQWFNKIQPYINCRIVLSRQTLKNVNHYCQVLFKIAKWQSREAISRKCWGCDEKHSLNYSNVFALSQPTNCFK